MVRLLAIAVRVLVFLVVLWSWSVAFAQVDDPAARCDDAYADCKDSCSLKHGMVVRDSERRKLSKCLNRCAAVRGECRERAAETGSDGLEEKSPEKAPPQERAKKAEDKPDAAAPPAADTKKQSTPEPAPKPAEKKKDPEKPKKRDRPLDEWDPEAL